MFSKACEYAIRASAYIAQQSLEGRRVNLKEIAATIGSPVAFTGKILQQLSRSGIVDSTKGAQGGFEMTRSKLDSLCLADIVMALDGEGIFTGCGLGLKQCNAQMPCPVHDRFIDIRNGLKDMLQQTSLVEVARDMEAGTADWKE